MKIQGFIVHCSIMRRTFSVNEDAKLQKTLTVLSV